MIIDPRAGHGPGIGGFKDDSQVGVALREGHPVYFVIFFRDPEPGQTLLDVCEAEQQFVKKVRELHPASAKPAIVGNCQGGWAAMMLAASDPEDTGPIVINGAPMSYWGGAFQEGAGDNPMRYAGGMLGGTWLSSFAADLGNGVFDGAYLVENFENLNPANTFWDKYYNLFANVDTEPPRFLEFERWWGGFYLMNREEIEWITRNLFVGNKLWSGTKGTGGKAFDLRDIKAPIVLFASMGDNITPPQQAFNWVADVYGSTDEIKARGPGDRRAAARGHRPPRDLRLRQGGEEGARADRFRAEVDRVACRPACTECRSTRSRAATARSSTRSISSSASSRRSSSSLNRFERNDEKPFEAVAALSDFNQRAYELFAQPFVQSLGNEVTAKVSRQLHPLRAQRWAFSDLNPWLAWLGPAAQAVKAQRQAVAADNPARKIERMVSEGVSASLDYYREIARRDERGGILPDLRQRVLALSRRQARGRPARGGECSRAARPAVRQGGAGVDRGRRIRRGAGPRRVRCSPGGARRCRWHGSRSSRSSPSNTAISCPTSRPTSGGASAASRTSSSATSPRRRSRRCRSCSPSRAIASGWSTLVRRLLADERMRRFEPTTEQLDMMENIGETLDVTPIKGRRAVARSKSEACAGRETAQEQMMPRAETETRMERKHEKYQRLLDFCKTLPPTPTAVAHPCDESSLASAVEAAKMGLITPILVGPRARIEAVAKEKHLDITAFEIVDAAHSQDSAAKAVALVREGRAEALMKGSLHTDELMGEVVKRDTGLRTARRVSHCFIMDVPTYAETLIVTDAAVNIAPSLADKVDIIQNAIDLAHALRFPEVRVAILSAMETVNPAVPSTVEAAALCKMADRRQITGAIVDGPLALDNAISLESVAIKKIDSPVAGRANVLVVPDLEAGNMLAKSLSFMAQADAAGIVLGARVPIILTSRADSVITRLASCAIAALVASTRRETAGKAVG